MIGRERERERGLVDGAMRYDAMPCHAFRTIYNESEANWFDEAFVKGAFTSVLSSLA